MNAIRRRDKGVLVIGDVDSAIRQNAWQNRSRSKASESGGWVLGSVVLDLTMLVSG